MGSFSRITFGILIGTSFAFAAGSAVKIPKRVINVPKPNIPRPTINVPRPNVTVNVPKPTIHVQQPVVHVVDPPANSNVVLGVSQHSA